MQAIEYVKLSAVELLKKEFKEYRDEIAKVKGFSLTDFQYYVTENHPEWDSTEGAGKIRSAWYGLSGNLKLTRIIQELHQSLQQ